MQPLTAEWVQKAEQDFLVAQRSFRARGIPTYDAVCFHAQQCAEKYLKARLQEAAVPFPKTHHLLALLTLLTPVQPLASSLSRALRVLDRYAVNFRYPGSAADRAAAREALRLCRLVRAEVRRGLGLLV